MELKEYKEESTMNNNRFLDIDLFQIQLFLCAAETLSFSHAGELMHVEQPTISRRIAVLEQTLGFQLFDRKSKPIRLTRKGQLLYTQWKPLISAFQHSLSLANAQREDSSAVLSVGMVDSGSHLSDAPGLSFKMRELYPDVTLTFRYSPMSLWPTQLEDGITDVAVTVLFDTESLGREFVVSEIITVPNQVCMLKTNPLAQKDSISYADLEQQKFISIDDSETPRHANLTRQLCRAHGFEPQIGRRSPNAHGLTSTLQDDNEVLICDRFLRGTDNPMFKVFELPEPFSGLCAVYSKENKNPYIQPYIKVLRAFYNHI